MVPRLMRVDGSVFQKFSSAIDYTHLHAGAQAWVEAKSNFVASRWCQQDSFHVLGEHTDGFVV